MDHKSYDVSVVVEESREMGDARRELVGDEGDMVFLPRFRLPDW